jgi:hypothetical protein
MVKVTIYTGSTVTQNIQPFAFPGKNSSLMGKIAAIVESGMKTMVRLVT